MHKLARNAISSSAGWFLTVFVAVVSTPVTAQFMGLEMFGIYSLIAGFLGFSTLLDFGIGQAVTRHVSRYNAIDDLSGLDTCVSTALNFGFLSGAIIAIGSFWYAPALVSILNIPAVMQRETISSFIIGGFAVVCSVAGVVLNSALMGLQRYDLTSLLNFVTSTVVTLTTMGLAILRASLLVIVFSNLFVFLVASLVVWQVLRRNLPHLRYRFRIEIAELKRLLQFSKYAFLSQVSSLFSTYVVRFTIGAFLGPVAVSYYVIPAKLISAIGGALSSSFGVLLPYASEISAKMESTRILKSYIQSSRLFAALAVPMFLAAALFAHPLLTLWMGEDFAGNTEGLLRVLALSSLIASLTTVPNTIVLGLGYSRIIGWFSFISVIIYSFLLPGFTSRWGLIGAAVVGLIATLPGLILVGIQTKRIIGIRIASYVRAVLGFHIVPILAVVSFMLLFPKSQAAAPLPGLLVAILLVCLYSAGMVVVRWIDIRPMIAAMQARRG